MITMFLGGLWHGAALHFICWGVYHGLLLILARQGPRTGGGRSWEKKVLLQIGCFHLIAFGWLLFRVQDLNNFLDFIHAWSRFTVGTRLSGVFYIILGLGILFHIIPHERLEQLAQWWVMRPVPIQAITYGTLLLIYAGMTLEAPSFIYFQF
jgi:D-alanyl-lipoteichoic acid acyltransferase DltB (MBOAT superfamily)